MFLLLPWLEFETGFRKMGWHVVKVIGCGGQRGRINPAHHFGLRVAPPPTNHSS